MKNLNYQTDYILYLIFQNILALYSKHGEKTDNLSIRIFVINIENRITFKIKTGYLLELLTPKTVKSFGSTTSRIAEDKSGKNVPHLEITGGSIKT